MIPVPKTTQSLARGAEQERSRQAKAYDMDRSHNQGQMDSIRRHQYSKQAHAVNKQKTDMQNQQKTFSRKLHKTMEGKKFEDLMLEMKALPAAGETGKKPEEDVIDVDVKEVKGKGMSKAEYREKKDQREQERADREAEKAKKAKEKEDEKKKKEEREAKSKGFRGGLAQELGGDYISRDKDIRSKAWKKKREEMGRGLGKGIKSAPGKVIGGAGKVIGGAAKLAGKAARAGVRDAKSLQRPGLGSQGSRPTGVTHTGSVTD